METNTNVYNLTRLSDGKVIRIKGNNPQEAIKTVFNLNANYRVEPCENNGDYKTELLSSKKTSVQYYKIIETYSTDHIFSVYVFVPQNSGTDKLKEQTFKRRYDAEQFLQQYQNYICSNIIETTPNQYVIAVYDGVATQIKVYPCKNQTYDGILNTFLGMIANGNANNEKVVSVLKRYKEFPNGYMDSNQCNAVGGNCTGWNVSLSAGVATYKTAQGQYYLSLDKIGDNR